MKCVSRVKKTMSLAQEKAWPHTGPLAMGLLPDTLSCGLCRRRENRERFPHHWLQRQLLVSDPGMHRGTCDSYVPSCMSGSLTRGGGEDIPGIPAHEKSTILRIWWPLPEPMMTQFTDAYIFNTQLRCITVCCVYWSLCWNLYQPTFH